MKAFLRKLKHLWFAAVRRNAALREMRDLQVFLQSGELRDGIEDLRGKRCLIVAPHPDDETIGAGATVRALVDGGGVAEVVFLTRGEGGTAPGVEPTPENQQAVARVREAEAERACRILGISRRHYLEGRDGALHRMPELADSLLALLESGDFDVVFAPWPYDRLPDHMAAFTLLQSALNRYRRPLDVWLYEVWAPLLANRLVIVDEAMERKLEALKCYRSQLACVDYLRTTEALAVYRSLPRSPSRYAEAFFQADREMVVAMKSPRLARHRTLSSPAPSDAQASSAKVA